MKIQALVRGNIERKRNAIEVQQMQAVLRAQARACAGRRQISKSSRSSSKFSLSHHPVSFQLSLLLDAEVTEVDVP